MSAQADRHAALEQASQQALAQLQDRLQQTVETGNAEIARLRAAVDALQRELEAAGREAAALRTEADRVPVLRQELQANRNERRREFERAPHALCRCTPEGVIAEANHALVALLGRRRTDDLIGLEFAAAASDYAGDLGWVIERARTTRKTESVEAHWKTRDGRRLLARVHALVTDGGVEIVVEDITRMRALEERLRQSERLEAAGRLAAEVAVTCEALLRDVTRDGHEWLAALGRENELHGRGELLLTEVARAASFLRQLGVFSNKQVIEGQPVSVPHVLRDLAPVLRRVVGELIEVVVPRSSGSFDVEVDAERIERVLVTVASYARDRMPGGGQVKIELASTIVGRKFVARHPHVRPGPHVVITVSELRRTGTPREAAEELPEPADNPGKELRGLAEIVSQCGGHLWLEAERDGNMVVKIHLPRRASSDLAAIEPDGRTERSGRLARWFRGTSAAVNS